MKNANDLMGKIINIEVVLPGEKYANRIGIVADIKPAEEPDNVVLGLLQNNGEIYQIVCPVDYEKSAIKSLRLSPEEREAYTNAYKAYVKYETLQEKFYAMEKEVRQLKRDFDKSISNLREFSDDLSFHEFDNEISKLFNKFFSEKYDINFDCTGWTGKYATLSIEKDLGKWLDFDRLGFIDQEYDGEYFVNPDREPEYSDFCKKNGPKSIPELDKLFEKSYSAGVGDKRSLSVLLNYRVPLEHGFTKSSLKALEKQLEKVLKKNKSIDEKIQDAVNRSDVSENHVKSIRKEQER